MFRRNFLFGKDGGTANLIDVGSEDLYQPGKGYGFVIEKNRREQELLQIRELNSSFDTMYWYQNEQLSFLKEDENGCYLDSAEEVAALERQSGEPMSGSPRRIPLIFKVDVPRQGNYRITLTIRSEEEMGEILIFTGRRRLAFHGTVGAGEFTYTMITNVCDIVPVGYSRIFADKTVDIGGQTKDQCSYGRRGERSYGLSGGRFHSDRSARRLSLLSRHLLLWLGTDASGIF